MPFDQKREIMSADQIYDEVALDFQESLQDLQNNNRYEISNLTIIAKENTEHAQAISVVLEKHIKTVRPKGLGDFLYIPIRKKKETISLYQST